MKRDLIDETLRVLFGTKGVARVESAVARAVDLVEKLESSGRIRVAQHCDCKKAATDAIKCIDRPGLQYIVIILVEKSELKHFLPIFPNSDTNTSGCVMNQISDVMELI